MRRLLPALLLLLTPALAVAAAPPPPLAPGKKPAALEDEGLDEPEQAAGGIKKKKDAVKRPPRAPAGPSGGYDGGGGSACVLAPSCGPACDLGPAFEEEAPRRPRGGKGGKRPRGRRPKPKQFWLDFGANGSWTASSIASGASSEVEGADVLLQVGARLELREGIGFDADNFTLFASDGSLPTWGVHLSFGQVTSKLRVRMAGGARVLVFDDPDVAQIWGFETGPSIDYQFTKRWRWDATVLYGQFPTTTTFLLSTGISYGKTFAPRLGYRAFLWEGVDHGPELGVALRF